MHAVFIKTALALALKTPPSYKIHETIITTLEEKAANALEMAAKAPSQGKAST